MKVDNRTPSQQTDLTLMNVRRKEKKRILLESRKPKHESEWYQLGEHWLQWIKDNPASMDIDDYANAHGYPAYTFKKAWVKESPIFKEYLERAYMLLGARRTQYLHSEGKLYLQILKQLPLYDWDLRDYQESLKVAQDSESGIVVVEIPQIPRQKDEHE